MHNRVFPILVLAVLGMGMVMGYEFMDGTLPREEMVAATDFNLLEVRAAREANALNENHELLTVRDKDDQEALVAESPQTTSRVNVSLFSATRAPKSR